MPGSQCWCASRRSRTCRGTSAPHQHAPRLADHFRSGPLPNRSSLSSADADGVLLDFSRNRLLVVPPEVVWLGGGGWRQSVTVALHASKHRVNDNKQTPPTPSFQEGTPGSTHGVPGRGGTGASAARAAREPRPADLGPGPLVPCPRGRQPVRRRRRAIPDRDRRQPDPDHHGQRLAGRRPHRRWRRALTIMVLVMALGIGVSRSPPVWSTMAATRAPPWSCWWRPGPAGALPRGRRELAPVVLLNGPVDPNPGTLYAFVVLRFRDRSLRIFLPAPLRTRAAKNALLRHLRSTAACRNAGSHSAQPVIADKTRMA
jgi:hypothetical protein